LDGGAGADMMLAYISNNFSTTDGIRPVVFA
jgi:hypothetical protein